MTYRINAPLFNAVAAASKDDVVRFHMPGHSGVGSGTSFFTSARYDLTEIKGLDNLLCPSGVIAQAEELAAKAYGCDDALISTQGASACMHIAMLCVKDRGEVLCIGDMHKSFWHAAMLYGLQVRRCDVRDLDSLLSKGGVGSVFVTSPDYFGNVADLQDIHRYCLSYGVALVADAAHGAHFPFSSLLPDNPVKYCDIAIFSQHKTMCSYGGGALMCVNKDFSDSARIYRQLIHSTSPSYLTMASIDYSRAIWSERGEEIYEYIQKKVNSFYAIVPDKYKVCKSDDISRLVIDCGGDAAYVCDKLQEAGIYCEAAVGDKLILILTPFNCDKLDTLARALKRITPIPLNDMPVFDLVKGTTGGKISVVDIDLCLGKTVCMPIGLYPPGTPQIFTGDIIDSNAQQFIKENKDKLFGLASGKVVVIE